jgi:hypothetical protein
MTEYVDYYNRGRPHQGIEPRCPIPIERGRDVLSGIIHDYYRHAA